MKDGQGGPETSWTRESICRMVKEIPKLHGLVDKFKKKVPTINICGPNVPPPSGASESFQAQAAHSQTPRGDPQLFLRNVFESYAM